MNGKAQLRGSLPNFLVGSRGAVLALAAFAATLHPGTAQAGVALRAVAGASAPVGDTTLTVNVPAGTAPNDVMIASVALRPCSNVNNGACTATLSPPAGWTLVNSIDQRQGGGTGGYGFRLLAYRRTAIAGEPGSYTWTTGGAPVTAGSVGSIASFSGVDTANPIVADADQTTPSGNSHAAPSINTGAVTNTVLVSTHAALSSGAWAPPGGMTEMTDVASRVIPDDLGISLETNYEVRAAAGATGTRTATLARPPTGDNGATHMLALRPGPSIDHIRILHDGSALTCQPESVAVQACADAACTSLYNGAVTTTLSPTGWIATDTVAFTGGSTTVQLRRTTPGTTTLGAAATVPTPARATRCFIGLTENCALAFADSGFAFDVPNLTACKPSAPVVISAVRKDDATQRCVPGFASGTRNVAFWSTYTNPISGTRPVLVNAAAVTGSSPGTNVSLNFDVNAQASFTVTYADAGQMQLAASFTGSGAETGLTMTGSDSFVSVPTGLAVYSDDPNAACTPASATCSVLARAGDVFALKVKAACWQSDGDTDLSDNPATPNFRMSGVPLSATLVAPAGGAAATLGTATFDFVAADAGIHTVGQTVSEVGVFRFSATPSAGTYFGATVPGATSANIGRFIPHHFTVAAGSTLTNRSDVPACTSAFTYMGEPLRLDFALRAENASGGLTQNYAGSFAKLELTQAASFDFAARNGATNLAPRLGFISPLGGSWSGGLATVAVSPTLARAGAPDGPYTQLDIGVAPRDADGVALLPAALDLDVDGTGGNDHLRLGRTEVRFGRARLDNAYGSELLDLPLALRLQHWNGQGFVDSPDDACTRFAASDFTLVFPSSPKNLLAACETVVSLAGGVPSALRLTRPGAGNSGWADLRLNLSASASGQTCLGAASSAATTANKAYLQGRWSGASYDQDPTARASFGTYRASGNLIYLRENY